FFRLADRRVRREEDHFILHKFSATQQPDQALLSQNHHHEIKGFMGQTTAFRRAHLKDNVDILADLEANDEARYIHGAAGKGHWAFYGGHDPEDYHHFVGKGSPNIADFKQSPGYRLILNNVLYPSAKQNMSDLVKLHSFEIYPNPNEGAFELRYETTERLDLEIEVYNTLQQKVYTDILRDRQGYATERIDLGKVSKGVYFLELRAGTHAIKRKVVVQ
ncbi:MAG: T9SS type A sorting domain-containing protein, partial [Bacteroidota bacterium]